MKPKILLLFLLFVLAGQRGNAQTPPYYNNFDSTQITGWSSYSILGNPQSGLWERGVPLDLVDLPPSSPNVWATGLDTNYANFCRIALESPTFDLSDTSKNYYLGFSHRYYLDTWAHLWLDYSSSGQEHYQFNLPAEFTFRCVLSTKPIVILLYFLIFFQNTALKSLVRA